MMNREELVARAKRRHAANLKAQRDLRYRRVLGRFVQAGLLQTTMEVELHREPVSVADALWAGQIEPRILEVLPAALIKHPGVFMDTQALPADLAAAAIALRRHQEPEDFRGIPGKALSRWLTVFGRRSKPPSRLKSFRLQASDLDLLTQLSKALGTTETEVLRRGLRRLAAVHLVKQ